MAHYAKIDITVTASESSDYSSPALHVVAGTMTPDEYAVRQRVEVATAGQTYYVDHYASISDMLIENTDSTNYVTVTLRNVNAATDLVIRVPAGKSLLMPSVTPASNVTLQANSAAVVVYISHLGT